MHYAPLITAATTSSLANILNSKNRRGAACADFAEENQKSRFWAEAAQRDDRLRLQNLLMIRCLHRILKERPKARLIAAAHQILS